jgi:hypothetical protein
VLAVAVGMAGQAFGHANYIGYSGAPGSLGKCAVDCHGTSGGTIVVSGFPAEYVPGQRYTIWVSHTGGASIVNFNCSIRDSASGQPSGTLDPGIGTEVYTAGGPEPTGAHFTTQGRDSGTIKWTAGASGTGAVMLYLSGLQSGMSGPNTVIVARAARGAGVGENSTAPAAAMLVVDNPVVRDYLVLRVGPTGGGPAQVRILSSLGTRVASIAVPKADGVQTLVWRPVDGMGRRLAPGSYYTVLTAGDMRQIRRFMIVR